MKESLAPFEFLCVRFLLNASGYVTARRAATVVKRRRKCAEVTKGFNIAKGKEIARRVCGVFLSLPLLLSGKGALAVPRADRAR
jgi:hypothetical protein